MRKQLGGIEPTPILVELSFGLQMVEKFASVHCTVIVSIRELEKIRNERQTKRHHKVQLVWVLERELERDDKGIIHER